MDRIFFVHANPTKVAKTSCRFWHSAEIWSADSNVTDNTEDELAKFSRKREA